jgi:hypothetical protein
VKISSPDRLNECNPRFFFSPSSHPAMTGAMPDVISWFGVVLVGIPVSRSHATVTVVWAVQPSHWIPVTGGDTTIASQILDILSALQQNWKLSPLLSRYLVGLEFAIGHD